MTDRRRLFGLVTLVLVGITVAYLGFGIVDPLNAAKPADATQAPSENRLIEPTENGTQLWPYTSRGETTEQRTLAINLLIEGSSEDVKTALIDRTELGFEEMDEDREDAEGDTYQVEIESNSIAWDDAHGSTRYSYVKPPGGGEWMDESYQLYSGEYMGFRKHIRAYDDPEGEWTAIQIHEEYFDMFRLRHTVTGAQGPATTLEREFVGQPFVDEVTRTHHGLFGGRSDGWLTAVDLASIQLPIHELIALFAVASIVSASSRRAIVELTQNGIEWSAENRHGYIMFGLLIGLMLSVRSTAIGLERAYPELSPQLFATGLYPIMTLGPLVLVFVFARHLDPYPAFGFAAAGLAMGLTLDMLWLGIEVLPVRLLLHRVGMVLSLGLFAVGVAHRATDEADEIDTERVSLATIGALAWFAGLLMPLLDLV